MSKYFSATGTNYEYAYHAVTGATDQHIVQTTCTIYYNARSMRADDYERRVDLRLMEAAPNSGLGYYVRYEGNPNSINGNNFEVIIPGAYTSDGLNYSVTGGRTISRYNKTDITVTANYATRRWWVEVTVTDWQWDVSNSDFFGEAIATYSAGGEDGYPMGEVTGGTGALQGVYLYFSMPTGTYNQVSVDDLVVKTLDTCQDMLGWNPGMTLPADLNSDCYVEWADFGIFASQWQACNDPAEFGSGACSPTNPAW